MKNIWKIFTLSFLLLSSYAANAEIAPRWEPLKDEDGDIVRVDRVGTKVEVDRANTTGWGTQKVKIIYRVKFAQPLKVNNNGQMVDEERYEIEIKCSNFYPVHMMKKHWYLEDRHTNVFNFGEKGRSVAGLIIENPPVYYLQKTACPAFDINARDDAQDMNFMGMGK